MDTNKEALILYAQQVKKMRELQTQFFKTREPGILSDAKRQESLVDHLTGEILSHGQRSCALRCGGFKALHFQFKTNV